MGHCLHHIKEEFCLMGALSFYGTFSVKIAPLHYIYIHKPDTQMIN